MDSGEAGAPGRERENVLPAPVLVTTLRLETALAVRMISCQISVIFCLSSAACGPWSDWGPCPDLSCSQLRTKECTETCDEGNSK